MQYPIIRFLPGPFTGEFRNIGAVAGFPGNLKFRLREDLMTVLPAPWAEAVRNFTEGLHAASLQELHHDHRNCIQLSKPSAIAVTDAEEALDFLFSTVLQQDLRDQNILVSFKGG